jgi:HEAT repeat protein
MLQDNPMPQVRKLPRGRVLTVLVACLCLAAALVSTGARAQQPSNSNAAQSAKPRTKRLTPLKSADAGQGSRVTITSDGELNDYSAYRSGDRFIVVIPQAQGGEGGGVKGRGFEGAQVSRRGNDLVYTFKLEPGATAKVNQRFNRLDVQFTATKQAQANANANTSPTPAPTPRTAPEVSGIKPTPLPAASPFGATKQTPGVVPPTTTATTNPNEVSPTLSTTPAPTPAPSESPSASPATAPATPTLIAQAQPTVAAPVSVVAPATGATTSTLGATIARNWYWIIAAMIGVGLVFLLVTRFGEPQPATPPPPADSTSELTTAKPALKATPTAQLEPAAPATGKIAAATTAATTAAATLASASHPETGKTKKGKKSKKNRAAARLAAQAETAKATRAVEADAQASTTPASGETKASEHAAQAAIIAAPLVAATLAAPKPVETKSIEKKSEPITRASAADAERVGEEMQKLLAGKPYDEAVVGASDPATREMVASELLAALSSRNSERNERARTAFLKHHYFEDATRDLQSAEAPAQRASAAHALSLLNERTATPHLVAALEDPSAEVRRASVEALAALKDPAALGPLEALRWRETSRLVPRSLIQHAVEACTASVEDDEATLARASGSVAAPPTGSAVAPEAIDAAEASAEALATREVETSAGVEVPVVASDALATDAPVAVEDATVAHEDEQAVVEEPLLAVPPANAEPEVAPGETTQVFDLPLAMGDAEASTPVEAASDFELTLPGSEHVSSAPQATETAEAVYSFDESTSDAWSARHVEDEAAHARRGTGGLEFESPSAPETLDVAPTLDEASPIYAAPEFAVADNAKVADDWLDIDVEEQHLSPEVEATRAEPREARQPNTFERAGDEFAPSAPTASAEKVEHAAPLDTRAEASVRPTPARDLSPNLGSEGAGLTLAQKGIELSGVLENEDVSIIPKAIQLRLESEDAAERAESVRALARLNTGEAFHQICAAFDDPAGEVRNAAARAVYETSDDRAESFTRALRESPPERRRRIGAALASSGLADEAVSQLTGESREKTYDAFSLLFLMAKAGESAPLIHAIESHADTEVRLAVVKLLALSGQQEVLPSFKRLAVRGSLPAEVRSAVMEAIYQISSSGTQTPKPSRTA